MFIRPRGTLLLRCLHLHLCPAVPRHRVGVVRHLTVAAVAVGKRRRLFFALCYLVPVSLGEWPQCRSLAVLSVRRLFCLPLLD